MAVATDPLVKHSHGNPISVAHTPGSAVTAGDVVVIGDITAYAQDDIAASRRGELYAGGVVTVTGDAAIAAGKRVYWDATNKKVTETEGTNKIFGITLVAFSADDERQEVLHDPDISLIAGATVDLNGVADALILDADGDTTISAPTDDQIDIEIAGADDFTFTANSFNVLTGSAIDLADSCQIKFGTGDDVTVNFDGTNLVIATAVADTGAVEFGADDLGVDVILYGDTSGEKVTWDQSADDLILTAAVRVIGQGSTVMPLIPLAAQQTLAAGGGAVTITEFYTAGASDAGGDAWTLADGAQVGQLKKIQLVTDGGGDATLTPTNLSGGTTITFADAGDYAVLAWDGTNWVAVELGNDADGATAPVLA